MSILRAINRAIVATLKAIGPHAKAIVAAVFAIGGALQVALQDGHITQGEYLTLVPLVIAAVGAVWGIPNVTADSDS